MFRKLCFKKLNLNLTTHQRWISLNTQNAISNIPSGSTVMIGGYSNRLVPDELIKVLSASGSHQLTIITNACAQNSALKGLIQTGKVEKLLTSLESNKSCQSVQTDLVDTVKFTKLCSLDSLGDYALIRSCLMDLDGFHYWSEPSLGNCLMAKWAKRLTISQFNKTCKINGNEINKLDRLFVPLADQASQNCDPTSSRYDLQLEPLVKRSLLELNNNDTVYFSEQVFQMAHKFYFPKHINVNVLNQPINQNWLVNLDWLAWLKKLNVCVAEIRDLGDNAELKLDLSRLEDNLTRDVMVNSSARVKIIALLRPTNTLTSDKLTTIARVPDLVITEKAVFKWNQSANQLEIVECVDDLDFLDFKFKFSGTLSSCLRMKSN